ncbi:hypothetical protein [Coxiella endosymbiont of Ornithodoros maritimus]|uniref:hypothetical protein n=1 Tax=Coxiella endosymbiont of Ornithodoros maritimus TaxID=1656172 RepID=UPI002265653B|nr:hypothetical protein [Coxiella endosymbiont of Ornithodoros maritimus]
MGNDSFLPYKLIISYPAAISIDIVNVFSTEKSSLQFLLTDDAVFGVQKAYQLHWAMITSLIEITIFTPMI